MRGQAFFAYSDNYLINVNAAHPRRQLFTGHPAGGGRASQTMIKQSQQRFGLKPNRLAGDTGYGSGENSIGSSTTKISRKTSKSPTNGSARMAPSAGQTFTSTRSTTFLSARRTRPSQRLVRWGTMARRCIITPARLTVGAAYSRRNVVQRRPSAGSRAASTKRRATLPARWPRPKRSNNHVVKENALRCCFAHLKRILRLGRLRLRGPHGSQSSSRWQLSPRTFVGSPN